MTGGGSSFVSRRLGGVRHAPEADIESIRDLLRGYGSPWSILKELIQNAEDAEASRMDVLYVPGEPASPHSLLRGPGLLVANEEEKGTFLIFLYLRDRLLAGGQLSPEQLRLTLARNCFSFASVGAHSPTEIHTIPAGRIERAHRSLRACPKRIALHMAKHRQKKIVLLDEKSVKPPFCHT